MRTRLAAIWLSMGLTGCATLYRDTARAAVVGVGAVRASVDALDTADAIVQPACPDAPCLAAWRAKRNAALEGLSRTLDALDKLTKGATQ